MLSSGVKGGPARFGSGGGPHSRWWWLLRICLDVEPHWYTQPQALVLALVSGLVAGRHNNFHSVCQMVVVASGLGAGFAPTLPGMSTSTELCLTWVGLVI